MGFKRTADGRVFFETPEESGENAANTGSNGNNMQVTGLLKALNERLKEAQLERGRLIRDLEDLRGVLGDMAQRTERAECAYIDLEQQLAAQQSEAFKKAERAERTAKETLGDMLEARNSLTELHERSQNREQQHEALQSQLAAVGKHIEEVRKRQAIIEKFQREQGEKMVDHVAAYVTLSKRMNEAQITYEALDNKIGEVSAQQASVERKVEKNQEERMRTARKIDRIEETLMQMRDTLNAKAMVVLADPNAAAFQQIPGPQPQAKIAAKQWQPQRYEDLAKQAEKPEHQAESQSREPVILKNKAEDEQNAWWQKSGVQTIAIALVLLAGVLAGWQVSEMKNPGQKGFNIFDRFKNTTASTEQPVPPPLPESDWRPVNQTQSEQTQDPTQTAQNIVSNWSEQAPAAATPDQVSEDSVAKEIAGPPQPAPVATTPDLTAEAPQAAPQVTPAPAKPDASDDIGMIDLNDQDKLAAALDKNPDAVAAKMNAIEPGTAAQETPAPQVKQTAPAKAEEKIASLPPQVITPSVPATTSASKSDNPEFPVRVHAENNKTGAVGKPVTDIQADPSLPKDVKQIETQAFAGVPEAQHDLAAIYIADRPGVPKNYERAAAWFRKAADNGIANARYNLGVLYQQGLGVERSLEDAIKWYTAAAELGHPEAEYNLGIAYIEGIGVPYDPFKASDYFEYAAKNGVTEAAYNLGLIYENGLLGQAQPQEALKWYKQAADGGSPEAKAALNQLAKNLNIRVDTINQVIDKQTTGALNPSQTATPAQNVVATRPEPVSEGALTAQIQDYLMRFGLYPGPADGIGGPLTNDAIRSYEAMNNLPVDGEVTPSLLENMKKRLGQ